MLGSVVHDRGRNVVCASMVRASVARSCHVSGCFIFCLNPDGTKVEAQPLLLLHSPVELLQLLWFRLSLVATSLLAGSATDGLGHP